MTYGFEVNSLSGGVQISTRSPNYVAIYSKVLNGSISLANILPSDLIVYTFLGGGVGGLHRQQGSPPTFLAGSHRVVVFREARLSNINRSFFGLEVFGEDGAINYTSDAHPMLFGTSAYTGMILVQPVFNEVPAGGGGVRGLSENTFCNINGVTSRSRFEVYFDGGPRNPRGGVTVVNLDPTFISLVDIPLTYTTNNVTGLP